MNLKSLIGKFVGFAFKFDFIRPRVIIVKMDGGICSQINFYLTGKYLGEATGSKVYYDLNWYDECGMDLNGVFCRNFDLLKAFPKLDFKPIKKSFLRQMLLSFRYKTSNAERIYTEKELIEYFEPPVFIDGYIGISPEITKKYFRRWFVADPNLLPADNAGIKSEIENAKKSGEVCAVHVRRGDLSENHAYYGDVPTLDYFKESMRLMASKAEKMKFFLFSDEPEWIVENLTPELKEFDIRVSNVNDSAQGWCDLILMSMCRNQICSQGSMGKFASMLRSDEDMGGMVIMPDNENSKIWMRVLEDGAGGVVMLK